LNIRDENTDAFNIHVTQLSIFDDAPILYHVKLLKPSCMMGMTFSGKDKLHQLTFYLTEFHFSAMTNNDKQ